MKSTTTKLLATLISLGLAHGINAQQDAAAEQAEIGVQQAVESSTGPQVSAGYEFQYIGRTNPFYLDESPTKEAQSRIMVHTFYGAVELNDINLSNRITRNVVGVMHQSVQYQESALSGFDYESQSVFYKGDLQPIGDWNPSIGLGYSRIEISEANLEAFDGVSPFISASKNYGDYMATIKTSYGFTDIKGGSSSDADRLNSWTTSARIDHLYGLSDRMGLKSALNLAYSYYNEGSNSGRGDVLFGAGTSLYYTINKYLRADLFADYTRRSSNGVTVDYGFNNWDAGLKLNAAYSF
ncbi:MAG: hypothetical protein HOK49_03495 [Opitutae bacterium]|jgi:hypothetical protein|nr:hypothetical protein [Opitutae bacterium]MBT5690279.1 hypothetical protein [Opitutae bacterium]MBT6461583.1 hypothetical protein [Opitutae bacterium]